MGVEERVIFPTLRVFRGDPVVGKNTFLVMWRVLSLNIHTHISGSGVLS
jgi:hypothetical protein